MHGALTDQCPCTAGDGTTAAGNDGIRHRARAGQIERRPCAPAHHPLRTGEWPSHEGAAYRLYIMRNCVGDSRHTQAPATATTGPAAASRPCPVCNVPFLMLATCLQVLKGDGSGIPHNGCVVDGVGVDGNVPCKQWGWYWDGIFLLMCCW